MHHLGMRHKHERAPLHHKEKTTTYKAELDKVTLVAGIIGPFTVLPQIYNIFSTHSAADVSLVTWVLMFIVNLPWIFYGMAHRDRILIASFVLWGLVNAGVVAGVLIYG